MEIIELRQLLPREVEQRREEGCDVTSIAQRVAALDAESVPELLALYDELMKLSPRPDFPYEEPSDLSMIRALRPAGPRRISTDADAHQLLNRILGAYLGRCAGCTLGKPVEGWLVSRYDTTWS